MRPPPPPAALLSIHDVMPETREPVARILERLTRVAPATVTLLVVPGRHWTDRDLAWLAELARCGYALAGHGWRHRCAPPRSLYHRVHGLLLSRDAAEHLSLSGEAIARLIRRCHAWFVEQGLGAPSLYVPPAWAMGAIPAARLARLPFRLYETLGGVLDAATGAYTSLPLVGFEADSRLRAVALRAFNRWSRRRAESRRLPLRIAVHPHDADHRLAGDLAGLLSRTPSFAGYERLAGAAPSTLSRRVPRGTRPHPPG